MRFKVRFTKEFTMDVEAESLDAAKEAARHHDDYEIEEMSGGAEWDADVWTASNDPAQASAVDAVVEDGAFVHPSDARPKP